MGAPIERGQLEEAIQACKGHQTAAAKRLGVTPSRLAHYLAAEGLMVLCRELRAASRAAALADHEAQRTARAADAAAVGAKRSAAVSKEQLKAALVAEKGCVGKAAERLGVLPGSVYKLVRKYDLLELQQTLAKETAAARHDATREKRRQYERERQQQRVRSIKQVLPQASHAPHAPQAAPELTMEPAPQQQRSQLPQRRNPPGGYVRCPPDPRIRHGGFDLDKPVVNRRY